MHRWVQRHGWDRAVEHYDDTWRDQLRPAHTAVLAAAALTPGDEVIEVACGTGMVTLPVAAAVGPTGRVVATDISGKMVTDTAQRAGELGYGHVTTVRTDAESLGADIGSEPAFDVALCALGLMYVPDPPLAVRAMADLLRPGGRFVAAVWGARRSCGWASIFPIIDSRVDSDVCPLFFALGAPGRLAAVAAEAGLADIVEQRITCHLEYPDANAAVRAAFLGGPVALAWSRFDEATRAEAAAEYLASIEPFRHGTGYRVPGEFLIVAARRDTAEGDHATDLTDLHNNQQQGAMQ